MSRVYLILLACAVVAAGGAGPYAADEAAPRFAWVDITLDAGEVPLAAYQLELASEVGTFEIVGIEGGEHAAFAEPPYYDPAALNGGRVILAGFSVAEDLPVGPTRVARVHVMITGADPQYVVNLTVAAGADGNATPAVATFAEGAAQ